MAAGDGLALGGFWPATFPLLRTEIQITTKVIYGTKASMIILTSALAVL
jgi:hypothetical protein